MAKHSDNQITVGGAMCDGEVEEVPLLNAILRMALKAKDNLQCKV